jgi:hypothetical protein
MGRHNIKRKCNECVLQIGEIENTCNQKIEEHIKKIEEIRRAIFLKHIFNCHFLNYTSFVDGKMIYKFTYL